MSYYEYTSCYMNVRNSSYSNVENKITKACLICIIHNSGITNLQCFNFSFLSSWVLSF